MAVMFLVFLIADALRTSATAFFLRAAGILVLLGPALLPLVQVVC